MKKRRTKIVATLGPASIPVLGDLITAGVDCFRLNFSHGEQAVHRNTLEQIRSISKELNKEIAVMADLQGPKIRVGSFKDGKIDLTTGQALIIDPSVSPEGCTPESIFVDYPQITQDVKPGDILLLDDGLIELLVKQVKGSQIHCEVLVGTELKDRKGINKLGGGLSLCGLSEKDKDDLKFALGLGIDYVAVSFVRNCEDIDEVRQMIGEDHSKVGIVAKIERTEAIDCIDEIIEASDGVMVARGDLGVELGYAKVPGVQKHIIDRARALNKFVITATQMMESMVTNTMPTRAEVSDVANAVLDGTDAVMLSAETATGSYPIKVIQAMSDICIQAEMHPRASRSKHRLNVAFERVDEAIAMATMYTANHLDIQGIICLTESGSTPLWMSRIRSGIPIFAMTREIDTMRRMQLYRGVYPIEFDPTKVDRVKLNSTATDLLLSHGQVAKGERVVLTKGDFIGSTGGTNSMKILTV